MKEIIEVDGIKLKVIKEEKSILFNGCLSLDEIIIQLDNLFKSEVE